MPRLLSTGYSVIQLFSHSVIQSFSYSVIQSFSHSVIQSFSHSVIQLFSHSVMGRIIGIDYGCKRTGIAVTDPLQILAVGLETVATRDVVSWLEGYVALEPVDRIVVGCPAMLDGSQSNTFVQYVLPFIGVLKKKFPDLIIDTLDERFTSKLALRAMIEAGAKKKDRRDKAKIDKISATILLQGYLEQIKSHFLK